MLCIVIFKFLMSLVEEFNLSFNTLIINIDVSLQSV